MCPVGTPVYACDDGVVLFSGDAGTAGYMVTLRHSHGVTRYLHNSILRVAWNEHIVRGQEIALSGTTGTSTGPHLHFDYYKDGESMDNGYGGRISALPYIVERAS